MIGKIKEWFRKADLPIQAAFRVIDADFDGFIGKKDLRKFLLTILKINENEVTHANICRLMKLLDYYKRDKITLTDMKIVFQHESAKSQP